MEAMTLPYFALQLRHLRRRAKLSQDDLALRAGVSRAAIARYELGTRNPTWEAVQDLAEALGVSCEEFTEPRRRRK
jgi:transcriptional regulator with XRE-family HTH domain